MDGMGLTRRRQRTSWLYMSLLVLASMLLSPLAPLAQPAGPGPEPSPSSRQSSSAAPDLVITNISLAVEKPADGATVGVFATVNNTGTAVAKDFTIGIFAAGVAVTNVQVATLAAGNSTTAAGTLEVHAGYLEIKVIADLNGEVYELSKANNVLVRTILVGAPDIKFTDLTYLPSDYTDGDHVVVTATVTNSGADTLRPFTCTLLVDQAELKSKAFSGLRSGDSVVMMADWTATAGPHELVARADTSDALSETNKSNNFLLVPLQSGFPDLKLESLSTSPIVSKFVDGDTVLVKVRLRNGGHVTHNSFDARLLVDGVVKDSTTINGLQGNATRNITFAWMAVGGKHELRLDADAQGAVMEANEGNNFALLSVDVPLPDLALEDLKLTPVMPADGSAIKASATVRNKGPGATNRTFTVEFEANGDPLGSVQTATGLKVNGTATVNFSFAGSAGKTVLAAIVDKSGSMPEANEANNEAFKVLDIMFPDLYLTNLTVSPNATSMVDGRQATVKVTVRNGGPGNTTTPFYVDLYLDGRLLQSLLVEGLAKGVPKVLSADFIAAGGTHYLSARADTGQAIKESNETNNIIQMPLNVGSPDLRVEDLSWFPTNPSVGQLVKLTAVVRNFGKPTDREVMVDFIINGTTVAHTSLLGPSLVGPVNAQVDYKVLGGENALQVVIDKPKSLPETNRTDDHLERTFPAGQLIARARGPDLVISDLSWLPVKPLDGESISFVASVKNLGAVPDPGPDGSKALMPSVTLLVDNEKVSESAARMLSTDGIVVVSWTATPGVHKIAAVVDWTMLIDEDNETNNAIMKDLSVGRSDLYLSGLDLRTKGAQDGNDVPIFVNVGNLGNRTFRSFQLRYMVDGINAGTETVEGASMNRSMTVMHTWTATPGVHTVLVIADMNGILLELSESNNFIQGDCTIAMPDLVLVSLKAPTQVDDGSYATVTATVKNTGKGGTLRTFSLTFYLDGQDLGTEAIGGLQPGDEASVSKTLAPTPGKHYLRAVVDRSGLVTEASRANNVISRSGLNVTSSDLAVQKVTIDTQDESHSLVLATLSNKGNSTMRSVRVYFYIDGDLRATDLLEGLAGGHNTTLIKELALGPGSHRLRVAIDPDHVIFESDESNNEAILKTPFLPFPNLYVENIDVAGSLVQGGEVRVVAKVMSLGAPVHRSFFVGFYIDGYLMGSTRLGGIAKGQAVIASFGTTALVGQHHLRVQVDPENLVPESNEMDNAQSTTYTINAPDLQVTGLVAYSAPNGVAVFARVRNNATHLLVPFLVSFYANGNLAGKVQVKGLPSMTSTQVLFTVPASTQLVRVVADAEGTVPETNETNNERSARVQSSPIEGTLDLSVADVVWVPQFPIDGERATFFVLIDNSGNRTTLDPIPVEVRLNGKTLVQDTVLGSPEGGTSVISFQLDAKAGLMQNLTVVLDAGHSLPDAVLENNILTTWFNVSVPELKVLNVSLPSAYFGEHTTMFVQIANTGEGDTMTHFSTSVSLEGQLEALDTVMGLPAGANTTVALEAERSWGQKEVLVEVDPENLVSGSSIEKHWLSNVSYGWPNLQTTKVWTETGANGTTTTAFAQIKDQGVGIDKTFSVMLYIDGKAFAPRSIDGLQYNGTAVLSWAFPTQDIQEIAALVDNSNVVPESNELDNYYVKNMTGNSSYTPPEVNLALTSLNITLFGVPRNVYRLDALVENQGPNVTGFTVRFLVDGHLYQDVPVGPMGNNSTKNVTVFYYGLVDDHVFKVIVDSTRTLAEIDEADNELRIVDKANHPPIPYPGNDQTITQGNRATLFARGYDPDGTIVRYEWDFDGDGKFDWSSNSSQVLHHRYSSLPPKGALYYNATLRVTDDKGAISEASVRIKVVEKKPWFTPSKPDLTRVVSFALGMTCIAAGLVILYLFMRASRPLKKTKAELDREKALEERGLKRPWPPWKREPKPEVEDEREAEPELEVPKPEAKEQYPDYPEEISAAEAPLAEIAEPPAPEEPPKKES